MTPFFVGITGDSLAQGDFLVGCPIPIFPSDFGTGQGSKTVPFRDGDLIIVTQSCDLENRKADMVALCPIFGISALAAVDPKFNKPKEVENIRRGRYEGLHMLASPVNPSVNLEALIADFRKIYSLPYDFLSTHTAKQETRWRLQSPFLEHFSQSFARFFMRVGLPSTIPEFK